MKIPKEAYKISGISNDMVKKAPTIERALPELISFIGDNVLIAHNAPFDMKFLLYNAYKLNLQIKNPVIDTLWLCGRLFPDLKNHKLPTVAKALKIPLESAHRSLDDAHATAEIFLRCIELLNRRDEEKAAARKAAKQGESKEVAG